MCPSVHSRQDLVQTRSSRIKGCTGRARVSPPQCSQPLGYSHSKGSMHKGRGSMLIGGRQATVTGSRARAKGQTAKALPSLSGHTKGSPVSSFKTRTCQKPCQALQICHNRGEMDRDLDGRWCL